eukprot:CAMPEP_0115342104 /NCGR_PEP_ID=MMETSP0270-20121206/92035_1 /TAXON_ID=71861 /ORGANISM="Scrippsiella trochoidea, Strain CCMP3099" /LENGTH=75 /DNA_ID=CAMNT_0002763669 /DNA_START=64 /DNA_END=288 /DNA_ORIENTATION=-
MRLGRETAFPLVETFDDNDEQQETAMTSFSESADGSPACDMVDFRSTLRAQGKVLTDAADSATRMAKNSLETVVG